jgi:outer membrane protein assembly factor BamB
MTMPWKNLATVLKSGAFALAAVFSLGAAGEICGSFFDTTAAAFDSKFPDNREEDVQAVLRELGAPQPAARPGNSAGKPLAVLLTEGNPRALRAYDLVSGQPLWSISPPVQSELTIQGDLLVFQSGQSIVGHGLLDGRELWRIDLETGWEYFGAAVSGGTAVVAVGVGGQEAGAYGFGRLIGLKAMTGGKQWTIPSGGGLLGTPAIHNGLVFVLWDRQKIAVIRAEDGAEIARVRAEDFIINYLEAGPAGVYYGSNATPGALATLVRLDTKAVTGSRAGSSLWAPSLEPVPGDPGFLRDGFSRPIGARSATEKIRFHWKPAVDPAQPIAMADGNYYLHYWKFVIAFDAVTSRVRWTYNSPKDIESVDAVAGGVVGVDTDGRLFFVDAASGREIWSQETGFKVLTGVFDAGGLRPPGGGGGAADPLIGLKELLWDKDNRMLPIRSYAAFLMADIPTPEVTRDLLAIYSDAQIPKGLRDTVVRALKKRTTGAQYLVDALHMRFDFLEQTQAPPMGVVAPALVNMNERAAVPGLLSHLMNHETPVQDLREIAVAIHALGDPSVAGTLNQFIVLYHADSSFIGNEDSLAMSAQALLTHGGQSGEQLVARIRDDPQTLPELQTMLRDILDPEAAAKAAAAAAAESAARAAAESAAQADAAVAAAEAERLARPVSLTLDQINDVVANNQQVLKPCVQQALGLVPNLQQIRMRFVITGETGKASGLQILPAGLPGLQECLANGLSTVVFPKFKNLRQPATYVISIQGQAPPPGYEYPPAGQQGTTYDPDSFGGAGGFQQPAPQPGQQQPAPGYDPDRF